MVLKGHYDGQRVVLDEPVPQDVPPNTEVKVVFHDGEGEPVLARIARLARPGGLPSDYAEQHEHYIKGAPRR